MNHERFVHPHLEDRPLFFLKHVIEKAFEGDPASCKEVPISKVQAVAPDLVDALGADVVKELKKDAYTAKAVVDSLPLDLKNVLARYC